MNHIDPVEVQQKYEHFLLDSGDYVVSSSGTIGRVAEVKKEDLPCMLNTSVIRMRPKDNSSLDREFLRYCILSPFFQAQINSFAAGSVQLNFGPSHLKKMWIILPPPSEQRAIAHILGTLDDKIELNRQMNETLEAMARALFKSWFVDFDPVRAKMEGRDTGLPERITNLFPSQIVESGLGNVPKEWNIGRLDDVAVAPRRGIDPTELRSDTPYIGLEHMPRCSIALTQWGDIGSVTSNKSAFENGEFLFGKLRPYFHKVGIAPVNGVCSTDIVVIKAKTEKWSEFVLACISSSEFVAYTAQTSTGTKMPRTSWTIMSAYPICVPREPVAEVFHEAMKPVLERIVGNVHENRTLQRIRDALLPKLLSGKLRVEHSST